LTLGTVTGLGMGKLILFYVYNSTAIILFYTSPQCNSEILSSSGNDFCNEPPNKPNSSHQLGRLALVDFPTMFLTPTSTKLKAFNHEPTTAFPSSE
jgi:hypothetical protein